MKKILFVCMGNICRSPAAEGVMWSEIKKRGLENKITCDSAGTIGFHVGASPDKRMTEAASTHGILLEGSSRRFFYEDFERFDLIIAMDRENLDDILALDDEDKYFNKVKLFTNYCSKHLLDGVPDPYYKGREGFNLVMEIAIDGVNGILKEIEGNG